MLPMVELDRCVTVARAAGCPSDQVERFLTAGYVPNPKAWVFHALARQADNPDGPTDILIGGARGGSKTHSIFAQVAHDDCQRYPGVKVLFLRKAKYRATESFDDLAKKILRNQPHDYANGKVSFPNGGRIIVGGYNTERDIDGYLGIEYDIIVIEEATQISETQLDKVKGSLRSSIPNFRARLYMSTNPGGIGHAYFKKLFVLPYMRGLRNGPYRYLPMTYKDNPWLHQEYIDYLERLSGKLGKAWRDGDWDVFEGQAFPNWNPEIHVIKPFEIDPAWMRKRGIDWGFAAPFGCGWGAFPPTPWPRVYVYREVYQTGLTVPAQARMINAYTPPSEQISFTYADPSMWARKTAGEMITSTASEYAQNGIMLTPADNDRLSGKRKVDTLLDIQPDGLPGLMVFETCVNLIRTLPELIADERNPEDVDTTQEDHAYDYLRYLLTNTVGASIPKKNTRKPDPWKRGKN